MKTIFLLANLFFNICLANQGLTIDNPESKNYEYINRYYPNGDFRSRALVKNGELKGYTELLPFVSSSVNQNAAGSCHFMALTGNAEFWLAKFNPNKSREPNGPLDLSERFFMNMNSTKEFNNGVLDWKTDTILMFNNIGKGVLNRSYPYTKGWWKKAGDGHASALPDEEGASYGTEYNWINETKNITDGFIKLPKFKREIIFADPEENQWNVMVTPEDIVEKVKKALVENQAPVTVMYNNTGIWHVVMIVGFDDELFNDNCYFTRDYLGSMERSISNKLGELENLKDENAKIKLQGVIKRLKSAKEKFSSNYKLKGTCSGKGGFYVRDSVYSNLTGPTYDYFTGNSQDSQNYAPKVIIREYEWLKYLANHVWQITAEI